jgi:hypothetical protein
VTPIFRSVAFAGLVACLGLGGIQASRAAQVVLTDPLTSWPLNFGAPGTSLLLKDGYVHITMPTAGVNWATYAGFNFTDQDSSVTITPKTTTGSDAGLVFWATGPSDFYFFGVSDTAGTFGIYRHVAATGWQPIVPFMANPNVKTGVGAVNTLRLVSKGNLVSLFVNGQPIGKLQIQAPPTGGTVGIIGEGSAKNPWDYAYSDLSVSQ